MPVIAYVAVISSMVVVGLGTRRPAIVVGALSFYVSDSLLGWNRFVARAPWRDVAVMVTYHVAQAAFVVSLF
ncbi:MAG: lysoplasmalogenase family protein [Ilumatobacteraceae bacterium]